MSKNKKPKSKKPKYFLLYSGPVSGLTDEELRKAWYKAHLIQDGINQKPKVQPS